VQPGLQLVSYHGYQVQVPANWPVYDLSADPTRCVRFDVRAVYLGTPGPDMTCPSGLMGRTEALLISPLSAATAPQTVSEPGELKAVDSAAGVQITASYRGNPGLVAPALHNGGIVSPALPAQAQAPGRVPPPVTTAPPPAGSTGATAVQGRGVSSALLGAGSASAPTVVPAVDTTTSPTGSALAPGTVSVVPASYGGNSRTRTTYGFDACTAPSAGAMQAWSGTGYGAVGVYIGGENRACQQANLNSWWIANSWNLGYATLPIYVGLQAPCNPQFWTIDPNQAATEGRQAAADAVSKMQNLGMGPGNPIYLDMESYNNTNNWCRTAVLQFESAWTQALHDAGYASGIYSSSSTGIADIVNPRMSFVPPDGIWFANWNSADNVYDPYVPDGTWINARVHQNVGGHNETRNGVTLNIDRNYLSGLVAGPGQPAAAPPPPPPPPAPTGATESLGAQLTGTPQVTSQAPGSLDLAIRGTDNALWVNHFAGGWSGYRSLGGVITSSPAILSWGYGRLDAFARGTDASLWHIAYYSGGWHTWERLGGLIIGAPTVANQTTGTLDVFVRGVDNALWQISWTGSNWTGFNKVGGQLSAAPAAVSWAPGRLDTFVRGTDGAVWHWQAGVGWESLGGRIIGAPGVTTRSPGSLDVFVEGLDGGLWRDTYGTPSWSGWQNLAGSMASAASAVAWSGSRIDIVYRGSAGDVRHRWWDNGSWGP